MIAKLAKDGTWMSVKSLTTIMSEARPDFLWVTRPRMKKQKEALSQKVLRHMDRF